MVESGRVVEQLREQLPVYFSKRNVIVKNISLYIIRLIYIHTL